MPAKHLKAAEILLRRESDGHYLILRSSEWPERPDRSRKLDLPGGLIDDGETASAAVVRELFEETGISITDNDLIGPETYNFSSGDSSLELSIYFTSVSNDPIVTTSWEHEAYYWYTFDEIKTMEIRQPFRQILDDLIAKDLLR